MWLYKTKQEKTVISFNNHICNFSMAAAKSMECVAAGVSFIIAGLLSALTVTWTAQWVLIRQNVCYIFLVLL